MTITAGTKLGHYEIRSHLGGNRALFTALGYELIWERPHPRNPAFTTVRMRKPLL